MLSVCQPLSQRAGSTHCRSCVSTTGRASSILDAADHRPEIGRGDPRPRARCGSGSPTTVRKARTRARIATRFISNGSGEGSFCHDNPSPLPSAASCHVCCSPPPAHRSVLGTDCDQYSALGEGGSAAASAGPALRQMSFCANSVNVDWWWVSERGGSRRRAAIGRRKTKRTVSRLATRHSPTAFTRHMTTSRATRASSGSSASACRLNTIAAHATTCRQE